MKTFEDFTEEIKKITKNPYVDPDTGVEKKNWAGNVLTGPDIHGLKSCLLYTSPSPRDVRSSRMPSSA